MTVDNEKHPVLGIDLGTTFSAIARWDGRQPKTYQNRQGKTTTQSVVYRDPATGEMLVGLLAYERGLKDPNPNSMVLGVKREMGEGTKPIPLGDKTFTPIEISSFILKRLYADVCDKYPGFASRGVVVTVPYHFKAHQAENTRLAVTEAGMKCIGIIQEPIAASLAYAWQLALSAPDREESELILVFDLGGGTFDLTLFRLQQTKSKLLFEVLATGGDDRLGGMDFDDLLVKFVLDKAGFDLSGLPDLERRKALQKVRAAVTGTKEILSSAEWWEVIVSDLMPGKHMDVKVTLAEFEGLIQPYVERIEGIIGKIWAASGIKPDAVDRVIRVGGSSKIPRMKKLLSDVVGEYKVWEADDPALSVAEGAAMYAAYVDDPKAFGCEIEIATRTSHALGIATGSGKFHVLVPPNRKTPCKQRQRFKTNADYVTEIQVTVLQGSGELAADNTHIGDVLIPGLPPRPRDQLAVWVTFAVNEEQRLSVTVEVVLYHPDGTEEQRLTKAVDLKFA